MLAGLFAKKGAKAGIEATTEFVKEGRKIIDEIFTTKEEKLEAGKRLFDSAMADRVSARGMYIKDSSAQKVLAIAILVLWVINSIVVVWLMLEVMKKGLEMPEWAYAMLGSTTTALTMMLRTTFDFYFGSSRGSQVKDIIKK